MKTIRLLVVAAVAMMLFSGCSKNNTKTVAWYKYTGLEDMQYVIGEEATVAAFGNELSDVMDSFDGTTFKDSEFISAVTVVVNKYTNGVIKGRFYLKKSTSSDEGPWISIKSWTMTLNSKYRNTKAACAAELQSFSDVISKK